MLDKKPVTMADDLAVGNLSPRTFRNYIENFLFKICTAIIILFSLIDLVLRLPTFTGSTLHSSRCIEVSELFPEPSDVLSVPAKPGFNVALIVIVEVNDLLLLPCKCSLHKCIMLSVQ